MKYFGTDGFRGEANVDLTAKHAFQVGRFLGNYFYDEKKKTRVIIGKDTRLSGYMYETALAAGLTASGVDVYEIHVTSTPSISYLIRQERFDFGIMITASHNPYTDNGIKVINGQGQKLEEEIEQQIEDYIDGKIGEIPYATGGKLGRCYDYTDGKVIYKAYLKNLVTHPFDGKVVALDLANGSASRIAGDIFRRLGAEVHEIYDKPDGMNINRHCGSTHIEKIQNFVKEVGADVGFAYDGDADRCLAVDENGDIITGDHIMYVCGKYLKQKGRLKDDVVVTTVMSNMGLYKAFDEAGIKYEQTAVGDKYVCANMLENGYTLGGEQSGHVIFMENAVTGDGVLTSLMIMEAMLEEDKKLSELTKGLTIFPQLLVNIRVKDKVAAMEDPDVLKAAEEVSERLGDSGRLLLRESGTEPLIRVMVEAETDELCSENVYKIIDVLKAKGHEE
ncbi:MAG: phosphoglucosamine mutase [Eubacterium sp.]|nr:phosphoglucosamine mutase [Eubacterium sp.]